MDREELAIHIFGLTGETEMNTLGDQKEFCRTIADYIIAEREASDVCWMRRLTKLVDFAFEVLGVQEERDDPPTTAP